MAKRWQPPPMNEPGADAGAPQVKVDEKVVRKMLQVNPAMRAGRTTFQVKRDLEGGQAVTTASERATTAAPRAASAAAPASGRTELDETLGFFLRGKEESFNQRLDELAARRRELESEEHAVRQALAAELAKFVSMLDDKVVALHGVAALSHHKSLLERLGVTPAQLLQEARRHRG